VRVVEYEIEDPGRGAAEDRTYRLETTILDPKAAPAAEPGWTLREALGVRGRARRAEDLPKRGTSE